MLSITTDYATDTGCPEPYLRRIAAAGFSHVHWCHHWSSDFMYGRAEVDQIAAWLAEFDLKLIDLHGSAGVEKRWGSTREYERQAGVELVKNRVDMTRRLGCDVVIMHPPHPLNDPDQGAAYGTAWRRSLDEVLPYAGERGVRLALENGADSSSFDVIETVFSDYGPDAVGLCYDCGHGNIGGDGLDRLDRVKDRLLSVHLHDNDGAGDQHRPLFAGTVDWPRLARIIAESSYRKCVSMETSMRNAAEDDETRFLEKAFQAGAQLARMIDATELPQ